LLGVLAGLLPAQMSAMGQLQFDVVYEERRYRLLKSQWARGLF
jgi:hypothetical protein